MLWGPVTRRQLPMYIIRTSESRSPHFSSTLCTACFFRPVRPRIHPYGFMRVSTIFSFNLEDVTTIQQAWKDARPDDSQAVARGTFWGLQSSWTTNPSLGKGWRCRRGHTVYVYVACPRNLYNTARERQRTHFKHFRTCRIAFEGHCESWGLTSASWSLPCVSSTSQHRSVS